MTERRLLFIQAMVLTFLATSPWSDFKTTHQESQDDTDCSERPSPSLRPA